MDARTRRATHGDHTITEISANRGKRSLALDLREHPAGDIVRRLVEGADVFLESSRPSVAKRLGIDHPTLVRYRPDLAYASFSGYGHHGPYAVLFARERRGTGAYLDIGLLQAAAALQAGRIAESAFHGGAAAAVNVPAGSYRTADGWIAVTLMPSARRRRDGNRSAGLCAVARHPHVRAVGAAARVVQPGFGDLPVPAIPGIPPVEAADPRAIALDIGADSLTILHELGFPADEIHGLRDAGVIAAPTAFG